MQNLKEIFNISKLRPILWSDSPLVFSGRVTSLTLRLATCDFEGKRVLTFIINKSSCVFLGVSFYIALALDLALHLILIIPLLVKDIIAPDFTAPDLAKGAQTKLPLMSKLNLKKICLLIISIPIISLLDLIFIILIISGFKCGIEDRDDEKGFNESTPVNYYETLGIKRTASKAAIKRAFKEKVLKLHPDKTLNNSQEGKERFTNVYAAYEALYNLQSRNRYDEWIDSNEGSTSPCTCTPTPCPCTPTPFNKSFASRVNSLLCIQS